MMKLCSCSYWHALTLVRKCAYKIKKYKLGWPQIWTGVKKVLILGNRLGKITRANPRKNSRYLLVIPTGVNNMPILGIRLVEKSCVNHGNNSGVRLKKSRKYMM